MRLFTWPLAALLLPAADVCSQTALDQPRPKLVVGIVVDQMRNEYIYRFWDRFGDDGFRRLVRDGYYFRNTHYNYIPTNTAPGHASIFTGTTPRHHGIIGNDWFDKEKKAGRYCVYDDAVKPVGTGSDAGKMSPHTLLSTTIGDELKLATVKKGKVFAVALKDRAAVLPGGHMADAAFWLEEETGNFVTSSWYMNEQPAWLVEFNRAQHPRRLLSTPWTTLYPIETYTASLPDVNDFEKPIGGKKSPAFPYDFSEYLKKDQLAIVRYTPYGNTLTREMAMRVIEAEGLGADNVTDFLSVSFSSTDIIGHRYGPRSVEIEDTYLRLDREIAQLLQALDRLAGKDNYVVFLTADHAACDAIAHLREEKIPAGQVYEKSVLQRLRGYCAGRHGDSSLVLAVYNEQVVLDEGRIASQGLILSSVAEELCAELLRIDGVVAAYPAPVLAAPPAEEGLLARLGAGYHMRLSGHIAYLNRPGFMDYSDRGTSHGSGYSYDTHVPLIFYGKGIPRGESFDHVKITQIAPTVTELIRVARPSACDAKPLNGLFRR